MGNDANLGTMVVEGFWRHSAAPDGQAHNDDRRTIAAHTRPGRNVEPRQAIGHHGGAGHGDGSSLSTVLPLAGMTCASCVRKVEKVFKRIDGIQDARVNLAAGSAGVAYDPRRVGFDQMEQAIKGIGYEVPLDRLDLLDRRTSYWS